MSNESFNADLPQKYQVTFVHPELVQLIEKRHSEIENRLAFWRQAAEEGNDEARLQMGINYLYGINGVRKSGDKAFAYFNRVEEDPEALYWQGICYLYGQGTEEDPKTAFSLFSESAEAEVPSAIAAKGACLEAGLGTNPDPEAAKELYEKASDLGDATAAFFLGDLYALGQHVEKDPQKASS